MVASYVDEPYLSIRWDAVHKHVFSEWKAFANSAELRSGLLKGVKAISDHGAFAYVSDARKVKVIVHADQRSGTRGCPWPWRPASGGSRL